MKNAFKNLICFSLILALLGPFILIEESHAFSTGEKTLVLNQLLDLQRYQNRSRRTLDKEKLETEAMIDSLIHAINGDSKGRSDLTRRDYLRALRHQLSRQFRTHGSEKRKAKILVDALANRIHEISKQKNEEAAKRRARTSRRNRDRIPTTPPVVASSPRPLSIKDDLRNYGDEDVVRQIMAYTTPTSPVRPAARRVFQPSPPSPECLQPSPGLPDLSRFASLQESLQEPLDAILRQMQTARPRLENLDIDREEKRTLETFRSSMIQAPSLDGNFQRIAYNVNDRGSPKRFLRYWNRGDGDCALHGIGETRTEFVRRVRNNLHAQIRADLREDVQEFCNQKSIPDCESILNSNNTGSINTLFNRFLSEKLNSNYTYLTIDHHIPDLNHLDTRVAVGSLAAAARVFQKNVRVWRLEDDILKPHWEAKGNKSNQYIDLIIEGQHYDRLIDENDFIERSTALRKEREFLNRLRRDSGSF